VNPRRTRRTFLTDLGRTAAGVVVVGFAGACSGDDKPVVGATASTDPAADPTAAESTLPADPATASDDATSDDATSDDARSAGAGQIVPFTVDLDFVAAFVLVRGGEAAIVDTGVAGSEGAIEAVLTEAGVGWGDVGHVILTHQHGDHAGSLEAVAGLASGAALYGGAADIPNMTAPREISAVGDGDTVFDLAIIETPGHTAGHLSVHDPASRLLITGDALVGEGGTLSGPASQFSADMPTAITSVAKLAELDVQRTLVSHGFPVEGGTAELVALAEQLGG